MSTDDIVVGSKWLDDAPGGYGEVTVASILADCAVEVRHGPYKTNYFRVSAFRHLFRPMVPASVPDALAVLIAAEEAFLISRGWRKTNQGTSSEYPWRSPGQVHGGWDTAHAVEAERR